MSHFFASFSRVSRRIVLTCLAAVALGVPVHAKVPQVVSTNAILHDLVRMAGGDRVEAICIVRPGMDVHAYEPRPSDVQALARADLLVVNGHGLEIWLEKLIRASGYRGPVVTASSGAATLAARCTADHGHEHHDHGEVDPHLWHDLANGILYLNNIRDGLTAVNPADARAYQALTDLASRELRLLDAWAKRLFAAIPEQRRAFVTAHDSLAYFGQAYGFRIEPLSGLSPGAEPDAQRVASLISFIRERGAQAVFAEAFHNPQLLRQIAREAGIPHGGELFTDTLAAPGEPGDTYPGMFRLNTLRILEALAPGS
jgi:zinc/manganese transport system substrate-binding protein